MSGPDPLATVLAGVDFVLWLTVHQIAGASLTPVHVTRCDLMALELAGEVEQSTGTTGAGRRVIVWRRVGLSEWAHNQPTAEA